MRSNFFKRMGQWIFLAVSMCSSLSRAQAPAPEISWEVVNRFPLFLNDLHFARIAGVRIPQNPTRPAAWHGSMKAQDTIDAPGFTPSLRDILPATEETAWKPAMGLYDGPMLMRTKNSIIAKSAVQGDDCQWLISALDGSSADLRVGENCSLSKPMKIDIEKAYRITLMDRDGQELAPSVPVKIKARLIVALGDSFASGEGNPDHPAILASNTGIVRADWMLDKPTIAGLRFKDNDTRNQARWLDELCHRSLISWPALAALRRAVENKDEVVRFASFACSGAEIYDGILTKQTNPPGAIYAKSGWDLGPPGHASSTYIESGNSTSSADMHTARLLRYSQIDALAHLVCDGREQKAVGSRPVAQNVGSKHVLQRTWIEQCAKYRYRVDDLLLMVGGNDAYFAQIVINVLYPGRLSYKFPGVSWLVNTVVRNELGPVIPAKAKEMLPYFPEMYGNVRTALQGLGISENRTQLALYPHVLEESEESDSVALAACTMRTRDGFMPMQLMAKELTFKDNVTFGARATELKTLRTAYIDPLRKAQDAARGGWKTIDTSLAFVGKRFCSVNPCPGDSCSAGDTVRWQWRAADLNNKPWKKQSCIGAQGAPRVHFCDLEPLRDPAEFDPYDSRRARGMRYGTDAFLTMAGAARKSPEARSPVEVRQDAMAGVAHPTGNVHARIADMVQFSD